MSQTDDKQIDKRHAHICSYVMLINKSTYWLSTQRTKSKTTETNNTITQWLMLKQKKTHKKQNLNINQPSSVITAYTYAYHCTPS